MTETINHVRSTPTEPSSPARIPPEPCLAFAGAEVIVIDGRLVRRRLWWLDPRGALVARPHAEDMPAR